MRLSTWWHKIGPNYEENPQLSIVAALRILRTPRKKKEEPIACSVARARRMLAHAFKKYLGRMSEFELLFLARYCLMFGQFTDEFEGWFLNCIQDETRPLAEPIVEAEIERQKAMNKKLEPAEDVARRFRERIAAAFPNKRDLTPFQRFVVSGELN
jgi:hypothetical protein